MENVHECTCIRIAIGLCILFSFVNQHDILVGGPRLNLIWGATVIYVKHEAIVLVSFEKAPFLNGVH